MKKLLKTPAIRYLILVFLAAAIGFNVFSLNASRLAGDALPMPFGYGASVVLSGSMEPALSVGDLLIVRQQPAYEVGDIVVYQSGTTPVVHRILSIDEEMVTTKGDANNANDEPFPITAIKGRVISAIPLVGYGVWALKSPIAVVLMIAAGAVRLCSLTCLGAPFAAPLSPPRACNPDGLIRAPLWKQRCRTWLSSANDRLRVQGPMRRWDRRKR